MDSDEERRLAELEKDTPPIRVRQAELTQKQLREISRQLDVLFKKYTLDKDVCVEIVKYMKSQPQFKKGDGEWQCIIGTNFGCSLSYDLGLLSFFDYLNNGKSILLFKSG